MNESDEIKRLWEEVERLKQEIKILKNHINHPPLINKILDYVREAKIITIPELRQKFPTLYGANLTDFYNAVRENPDFTVIEGRAQWYPTVVAYTPNKEPKTPEEIAVDYFKRIPIMRWEIRVSPNGRRYKVPVGKAGSIQGIMDTYKITREQAETIMNIITTVFAKRILLDKKGEAFLRKF